MPRYFFNIHDGVRLDDKEGQELPDLTAVRHEAVRRASRALDEDPGLFWNGDDWSIDVKDENDIILFTLHFIATEAPVLNR